MAQERTLGLAKAQGSGGSEPSKEELQRRMEEARDSISTTVTEIKETVANQVENVKDALDWREHFKKQPVVWSLGAAGVGFLVGYGLAAAIKGEADVGEYSYSTYPPTQRSYASRPLTSEQRTYSETGNGDSEGPGLLTRFKETSAYDRLSKEAATIGDRLVNELSTTAQNVVLPALLAKIKDWVGLDLSEKKSAPESQLGSAGSSTRTSAAYEPITERPV